jgi:integrase
MQWRQVDLLEHFLSVGRCKTKGGEGRVVPLNQDAYSALTQWRQSFGNPLPFHFVFPSAKYGLDGEDGYKHGTVAVWNRNPDKLIGSWKVAWGACRKLAGVECRLHDLRHTFVSRLADRQTSDQTVMALAGHMSRKMMERYSHARNEAKRFAVDSLHMGGIPGASPQFPTQQNKNGLEPKLLILNGRRGGNRTHNPRLRRPVLYPIELLARVFSL